MRKFYLILIGLFLCATGVDAAERARNTSPRQSTKTDIVSQPRATQKRTVSSRSPMSTTTNARAAASKVVVGRSTNQKSGVTRTAATPTRTSRAATTTVNTRAFGNNYNSCRDAYFTCMDQICAVQNENYRRCVCSSKLKDIQAQEKALNQTSNSLKDFESLNIDMISKTSAEVKAMMSASEGEAAIKKDTSTSANTLSNISSVLDNSKQQSLSTGGRLDIAGDIKSIWATTDFIGGTDLANLSGEALFNAIHTQCNDLVQDSCNASDLKMVASAYGMYIENDCAILQNNLDTKLSSANAAIRSTRHKMQDTRLDNYNIHNSLTINDCIANIRKSLTADTACGDGYIHCLDFSGKYLNITTGEAIYSPEFYQIENQISLSGDILKNSQNSSFITMLNKKRSFAQKDLDLCSDNANDVWNEFLRQALVEIYQGQQKRVETVKTECLQVVNECYLKQSEALKQFADNASPITTVQTLELSEEMCADKLNTCSNLYGGGPDGLETLVATMTGITNLTIEQSCPDLLATFSKSICAVSERDSLHSYPYGCRKYAPGESYYAGNSLCNKTLVNPFSRSDILTTQTISQAYMDYLGGACRDYSKRYTRCNVGYYLFNESSIDDYNFSETIANECRICPSNLICPGGTQRPISIDDTLYSTCGQYYIGSLYQQLVIYALQNCTRTSDNSYVLSKQLQSEVDKVFQSVKTSLISALAKDCSDLNGIWVNSVWIDNNNDGYHDVSGDVLFNEFYITTGANKLWGYCKDPTQ